MPSALHVMDLNSIIVYLAKIIIFLIKTLKLARLDVPRTVGSKTLKIHKIFAKIVKFAKLVK